MTTALTGTDLPRDWVVTPTGAGVDLRVRADRRIYLQLVAWALALWSAWWTVAHWHELSSDEVKIHVILSTLLALFALWCSFADEYWHLEQNLLVHRVAWWSSTFRESELQICMRRQHNITVNRPYYRLYAISNGRYRFLMERNLDDLKVLARFIAQQTGWDLREMMLPWPERDLIA